MGGGDILDREKNRNQVTHFETSNALSSDNMAKIAIRYIWSDMLWAQSVTTNYGKLNRTNLSGFGICKPL
jgi:hypothetical protein